ncbi:MAG: PKD domain-containing protein [Bacteroidota bacterium]|nr:PKD domain-containing protein [Bacteroidota bacterium]
MKLFISIALTIIILCSCFYGFSQNANLEFVENKGQWDNAVKFKGVMNSGAFFLQEKGFSVVQHSAADLNHLQQLNHASIDYTKRVSTNVVPVQDNDKVVIHSHSYNVQFVNANTPVITGDKPLASYNNYFLGNDPAKWKGNCSIYQAVTYKNIYPGIDVRYYTNEGKLKYDIVVNAGADMSRIALKYEGVEGLEVRNEQLVVKTSVGNMGELAPYAYQVINGQKKTVDCRFKVAGSVVKFAVGNYTSSSTLVLDPTLVFSTFTGSTSDNWGYTATYDTDGSFYAGGIVFGTGFKTSPGAFQTTYAGGNNDIEGLNGFDIGIMKFSPDGRNRTYATYIGGSKNEYPHSLISDAQGNLIIAGRTSSDDYPVKSATYGDGGGYDIVITKLNAAGNDLIGSKKIGGKGTDGVNIAPKYLNGRPQPAESLRRNYGDDSRSEVILDKDGNILLASCTQSSLFPTTPDAFQKTFGGKQDGVFIKASSDVSNILFSSYIGGSENDAAFVLAINPSNNNIYLGGNTVSADLPGDKSGVLTSSFQGGQSDGFVSIISPANQLIKTTYIGTPGDDMLYGVQFDRFGFPYVMGTTTGSWAVVNASFSQAGGKQYISKLKPDLSGFEYSTVFGTNNPFPNISPIAFLVDRCENVYVSGWGGSIDQDAKYPNAGTTGLSVTSDALQSKTDGSDFYFFVLERNAGKQLFGSFFGQNGGVGEHVDGGTSRFDRNGVIYQAMCANCGRSGPFPTTPGVWSPNNGSDNCNLAAVKIAFNLAGVAGSVRTSIKGAVNDTTGCVPLTVDFTDTLAQGHSYIWNFGDNTGDKTTGTPSLSHTYNAVGDYRVRLVSIDSSKCNVADTAYTNIRVKTFKGVLDFNSRKLPPCESFNYSFSNTSFVSPPARTYSSNSFKWDFGDKSAPVTAGTNTITHSFPGTGSYVVKLILKDTTFCNSPDSIEKTVRISANLKASFKTPASGCAPYTGVFDNTSDGGQQFNWNFGDGTTSTEASPQHLYATPGNYVVNLMAIDSATCNIKDSASITITVAGKPKAAFSYTPNPPQENTPVQFLNSSLSATRFKWIFGDGDSLLTMSANLIQHVYNETKTFNTCLVALNNAGCSDTTCQPISALIVPVLDVPNAFTPNKDGVNDVIFVRGFAIKRMLWRIYNRWGTIVFETSDRTYGWDGTYKGATQPNEVYHYVLDVEFSDNTSFQKKGDITLLK